MLPRTLLLPPLLALFLAACQPPAEGPAELSDAEVTAIENAIQGYVEAVRAGDPAAVAATYTEEGVELPPGEPARGGRAAIRAAYEANPTPVEFTLDVAATEGVDGLAYSRGTYTFSFVPEGAEEAVADAGKFLVVLRRASDGAWLADVAIWNSTTPPEMGEM